MLKTKRLIFWVFACLGAGQTFAQFRSAISLLPEVNEGYSYLSLRDNRTKPFQASGGDFTQLGFGLNIPYSNNLTLKTSAYINQRHSSLTYKEPGSIGLTYYNMETRTINVGINASLLYTKYFKKYRALYLGLGYFISYGVGGNAIGKFIDSDSANVLQTFVISSPKELYNADNGLFDRKNEGVAFTAAYKGKKHFYYSLFYHLGVANLRPDKYTKFSSLRSVDMGVGIGYMIRTD